MSAELVRSSQLSTVATVRVHFGSRDQSSTRRRGRLEIAMDERGQGRLIDCRA
jgi:hypothetical protein